MDLSELMFDLLVGVMSEYVLVFKGCLICMHNHVKLNASYTLMFDVVLTYQLVF